MQTENGMQLLHQEKKAATFAWKSMQELSRYDQLETLSSIIVRREQTGWRAENVYELKDEFGYFLNSMFYIPANGEKPGESQGWYTKTLTYRGKQIYMTGSAWHGGDKKGRHDINTLISILNRKYGHVFMFENNENVYSMYKLNEKSENQNNTPVTTMQPSSKVKEIKQLLDNSGQVILQGAPGCGKTYITTELAVYLCDGEIPADRTKLKNRYKELQAEGRIGFTTFHQSLDYEEFVEGYKPKIDEKSGDMHFLPKKGIFRDMCDKALELANDDSCENKSCVLIIDEINRANISKVLGELITLLEKSKRLGNDDEFTVTLPYTNDTFGVPDNLYIVGTMNTADRSLGYIDYAIRRRFAFMTLESDPFVIREFYNDRGYLMEQELKLYEQIRTLINKHISEEFDYKDIMVGHSYFLAKDKEEYDMNLNYKIRPLLEEYLRDGILVENGTVKNAIKNLGKE